MMAEAQLDKDFGSSFRRGFLSRRRRVLREILQGAKDRGEVAPAADLELVAEVMFAALWYRVLSRSGALNRRFADQLTDTLLTLLA